MAGDETVLPRTLGPLEATTIVVGGIIGTGIFVSPAIVARTVGAPGMSLAVWVVAGLIAGFGGLCYAELSSAMPQTGGTYVFLKRAYRSPFLAFLFGWAMFFASFPGPIAAVAAGFSDYAGYFLGGVMPYGSTAKRIVAVTVIVSLTGVNYVSVRWGGRVQNAATILKVAALLALVMLGLALGGGNAGRFSPFARSSPPAGGMLAAFGTAMIAALFAYNGWTYSSYVGGEVRNPERTLPLSILLGLGVVLVVYLLVNVTYIYVVPFERLATSPRPAADTLEIALGRAGGAFISLAVMISTLGAANSVLLSCARSYYAMAKDGLFFRALERVHPRYRTPANAVLAQGILACAFAISGGVERILTYYAFIDYFFFTLAVAGVIILRRREPALPRPYRVWGYPFTPLIFLVVCSWYLANTLAQRFGASMVGIALTLTGVPFYFYWSRRLASAKGST